MPKGIVFDFDGVIAETEPLQLASYNRLLEKYDVRRVDEPSFSRNLVGLPTREIMAKLFSGNDLSISTENLISEKESEYNAMVEEHVSRGSLKPRPGLEHLLYELRYYGWKIGIASSSPVDTVRRILSAFCIATYFDDITSSEEVSRGKPAPDIYIAAVGRLGLVKERVIAVEDSRTGLEAACAANLRCVVIPSKFTLAQDFSGATRRITSFEDLHHRSLMAILGPGEVYYVPKSLEGYCSALYDELHCAMRGSDNRGGLIRKTPQQNENAGSQRQEVAHIADSGSPDALVIVPFSDEKGLADEVGRVAQAGTMIVTVDQGLSLKVDASQDLPRRMEYFDIAVDFQKGGKLAADVLLKAIGKRGNIAIVSGPKGPKPAKDRRMGFLGKVTEHAPDVRVEYVVYAD